MGIRVIEQLWVMAHTTTRGQREFLTTQLALCQRLIDRYDRLLSPSQEYQKLIPVLWLVAVGIAYTHYYLQCPATATSKGQYCIRHCCHTLAYLINLFHPLRTGHIHQQQSDHRT